MPDPRTTSPSWEVDEREDPLGAKRRVFGLGLPTDVNVDRSRRALGVPLRAHPPLVCEVGGCKASVDTSLRACSPTPAQPDFCCMCPILAAWVGCPGGPRAPLWGPLV